MGSKSRAAHVFNGRPKVNGAKCELCGAVVSMSETRIIHLLGKHRRVRACRAHSQAGAAPAYMPHGRKVKRRRNGKRKGR